jgi:predicted RNase H-like HicB family nuclease
MVAYYARFEPDPESRYLIITFPDIEWGVSQGENEQDAREMATDLLRTLLGEHMRKGEPIPKAKTHRGARYHLIALPTLEAAKEARFLSELWDDVAKPPMVQIGGFLFFHNFAVPVGEHQPGLSRGFVPSGILVPSGVVNDAQQRIATPGTEINPKASSRIPYDCSANKPQFSRDRLIWRRTVHELGPQQSVLDYRSPRAGCYGKYGRRPTINKGSSELET